MPVEEHRGEGGDEAVSDVAGRFRGVGEGFGLQGAEDGDAGAKDIHGMGGGGEALECGAEGGGQAAEGAEFLLVGGELGDVGKGAVNEEVGDFFKDGVGGEREDIVAAIVEVIAAAADGAEGGVAGGGAGEGHRFFRFEGVVGSGFGHDADSGSDWTCVRA